MQENKTDLKKRIKTLKNIAITMREEADDHKTRLDNTQFDVENALQKIKISLYKIRGMRNVRFSHTFYMFLFALFFFIVLYFTFT